jgi:hypothetical protein
MVSGGDNVRDGLRSASFWAGDELGAGGFGVGYVEGDSGDVPFEANAFYGW